MWRKLRYVLLLDKYKRGYGAIVRNKVVQGIALAWPVAPAAALENFLGALEAG